MTQFFFATPSSHFHGVWLDGIDFYGILRLFLGCTEFLHGSYRVFRGNSIEAHQINHLFVYTACYLTLVWERPIIRSKKVSLMIAEPIKFFFYLHTGIDQLMKLRFWRLVAVLRWIHRSSVVNSSREFTRPLSLSLFLSFFLAFFLSFLIRRRFIDDVDGGGGGVVGDGCVKKESRVSSSLIGWTARGLRRSQSVALNEIHHFPESLRRLWSFRYRRRRSFLFVHWKSIPKLVSLFQTNSRNETQFSISSTDYI